MHPALYLSFPFHSTTQFNPQTSKIQSHEFQTTKQSDETEGREREGEMRLWEVSLCWRSLDQDSKNRGSDWEFKERNGVLSKGSRVKGGWGSESGGNRSRKLRKSVIIFQNGGLKSNKSFYSIPKFTNLYFIPTTVSSPDLSFPFTFKTKSWCFFEHLSSFQHQVNS